MRALLGAVVLVAMGGAPAWAQQTGSGVEKVVTSPAEIPKEMEKGAQSDAPVAGTAGGAAVGAGKTAEKDVEGAGEMIINTEKALTGQN